MENLVKTGISSLACSGRWLIVIIIEVDLREVIVNATITILGHWRCLCLRLWARKGGHRLCHCHRWLRYLRRRWMLVGCVRSGCGWHAQAWPSASMTTEQLLLPLLELFVRLLVSLIGCSSSKGGATTEFLLALTHATWVAHKDIENVAHNTSGSLVHLSKKFAGWMHFISCGQRYHRDGSNGSTLLGIHLCHLPWIIFAGASAACRCSATSSRWRRRWRWWCRWRFWRFIQTKLFGAPLATDCALLVRLGLRCLRLRSLVAGAVITLAGRWWGSLAANAIDYIEERQCSVRCLGDLWKVYAVYIISLSLSLSIHLSRFHLHSHDRPSCCHWKTSLSHRPSQIFIKMSFFRFCLVESKNVTIFWVLIRNMLSYLKWLKSEHTPGAAYCVGERRRLKNPTNIKWKTEQAHFPKKRNVSRKKVKKNESKEE